MSRDFFGDNAVFCSLLILFDFAPIEMFFKLVDAVVKRFLSRYVFFAQTAFKIEQDLASGFKFFV